MSVLAGHALESALGTRLFVTPIFDSTQIGASSIDLRLGCMFVISERTRHLAIDPRGPGRLSGLAQRVIYVPLSQEFVLHPRAFALAVTLEYLALTESVFCFIEGRSSPGRTGLLVVTAGAVHPGYAGCPTLELVNAGETPIILRPGDLIAQLVVLDCPDARPTDKREGTPKPIAASRYQVSIEPQFSRWFADREKDDLIRRLPRNPLYSGDQRPSDMQRPS